MKVSAPHRGWTSGRATPSLRPTPYAAKTANPAGRHLSFAEICPDNRSQLSEYLSLYQQHTTLKAKYEVLSAEYEQLRKDYESTASELNALKEDIKTKAAAAAKEMQKI